MFKKNKEVDFFELFIKSSEYACMAADMLLDLVKDYTNVPEKVAGIKKIEQQADDNTHTIYRELHKAFITPIEREDILELNHSLDSVVDDIEEASQLFDMFNVITLEKDIIPFVEITVKATSELKKAVIELKNFKKSKELREKIIEINTIEEEGDKLYREAVKKIFTKNNDPIHVTKWYEIYTGLENGIDNCEKVANIIEDIIIKNS